MGRTQMNSDKLAHELADAVEESSVDEIEMSVDWSEHMEIVVYYRGRTIIPSVRSIMQRDEIQVSDVSPDHFGNVEVEMRVSSREKGI